MDYGLLKGKVTIVTGARKGIGKATALRFAENGADVAIVVRELNESVDAVVAELAAFGTKVKAYAADVAVFSQVEATVAQIHEDFGKIDVLVNNAGITRDALMLRMSEEQWDEVITNNLKSAFNFTHAVVPIMMRQRYGNLIYMSSIVGMAGNPGQCNYAASKGGMIALAKSMAKEGGNRGIRSNCVAPGFIISEMTDKVPEQIKEQWIADTPLKRGGTVEEVADAALFLASDLSTFITGQVINVSGGKLID